MFPIAIIAGVIGAAVSTAQGASWIQDHVGSSGDASSVGGKSGATSQTASAGTSPSFEAALAAQATGQSMPTSSTSTASSATATSLVPQATSYDTLERTKAGIAAYSQHGEHHAKASSTTVDNSPVTRS